MRTLIQEQGVYVKIKLNLARVAVCCAMLSGIVIASSIAFAADFSDVSNILGLKAEMHDDVAVFRLPRNDIKVTIDGESVPTALGFGGWTAWKTLSDGTGMVMVMGDLVLLEKEINPVISAPAEADIDVSAIHNHFLGESPRIMFMHVDGMGNQADLARGLKKALSLTGTLSQPSNTGSAPPAPSINTARIEQIIGEKGQTGGGVFKITIGRPGTEMHEEELNAVLGLNTWAAFIGTDQRAHVAGDVAMSADEVNPVIRALRQGGIDVVAVHNHMLTEEPRVFFLHYWGTGPAEDLARTLKSAFDQAKGPVR